MQGLGRVKRFKIKIMSDNRQLVGFIFNINRGRSDTSDTYYYINFFKSRYFSFRVYCNLLLRTTMYYFCISNYPRTPDGKLKFTSLDFCLQRLDFMHIDDT